MRTDIYDRLIMLHRKMHDSSKLTAERIQAASDFERIAQTCDDNTKKIIYDAIGEAPSITASLLYTLRAASNDYVATSSFFSAAETFFKVANTRLYNPTHEERDETNVVLDATRSEPTMDVQHGYGAIVDLENTDQADADGHEYRF
ncbi:hypothetical protein [Legionella tunisiensis]|uniref:hypothetical protein n=1 Tax=Legionella tunisiensis TaxID=1034944 RepID=UPI0012EA188E|nr:hypothetical protein [Legionella tunisiensis]